MYTANHNPYAMLDQSAPAGAMVQRNRVLKRLAERIGRLEAQAAEAAKLGMPAAAEMYRERIFGIQTAIWELLS